MIILTNNPDDLCNPNAEYDEYDDGEEGIQVFGPEQAFYHALNVIKGRFPEAERVISKHPGWACNYAFRILEGRFPEAECVITQHQWWTERYDEFLRLNGMRGLG